jgi:glycosyltransferase involved in cell wall biosynthesis
MSPYHTGSHAAWADGCARHSRHDVTLLTMAGRFWKWRMQGGAIELAALARKRLTVGAPDVIVATDMLNLPAWLALLRRDLPAAVPVALYMHENQLTYPWRPGEGRDLTYAMINWQSQLCADRILFNSAYHRAAWFAELPNLLKHFPDYNHVELVAKVAQRSQVLPLGIEAGVLANPDLYAGDRDAGQEDDGPRAPLILWNQRWEHDKRPDRFFAALYRLQDEAVPFRLAVAGENFRNVPEEFAEARTRLQAHITQWGYVESRAAYVDLLRRAALVISTADHEFFGISVLEAIAAGAFPLLPRRLSYPELIAADFHQECLYDDEEDLVMRMRRHLLQPQPAPLALRRHVADNFDWCFVAPRYDRLLDDLADSVP